MRARAAAAAAALRAPPPPPPPPPLPPPPPPPPPPAAAAAWRLGDARRHAWPLFGARALPHVTAVQRRLAGELFGRGARYLGDEDTMVRPGGGAGGAAAAAAAPWVEVAFMGRSNAGKSTLLNALLGGRAADGARAFVPVSRRPGSTARLDFYGAGAPGARPAPLVLVDTPGYGFSSRGRAAADGWLGRMAGYLRARRALASGAADGGALAHAPLLARVVVLVDARLGVGPLDAEVLAALDAAQLPCHVVLSKADLVGDAELERAAARAAAAVAALRMPFPVLNAVSARGGGGLPELRHALLQTSKVHRLCAADAAAHARELAAVAARGGPAGA